MTSEKSGDGKDKPILPETFKEPHTPQLKDLPDREFFHTKGASGIVRQTAYPEALSSGRSVGAGHKTSPGGEELIKIYRQGLEENSALPYEIFPYGGASGDYLDLKFDKPRVEFFNPYLHKLNLPKRVTVVSSDPSKVLLPGDIATTETNHFESENVFARAKTVTRLGVFAVGKDVEAETGRMIDDPRKIIMLRQVANVGMRLMEDEKALTEAALRKVDTELIVMDMDEVASKGLIFQRDGPEPVRTPAEELLSRYLIEPLQTQ